MACVPSQSLRNRRWIPYRVDPLEKHESCKLRHSAAFPANANFFAEGTRLRFTVFLYPAVRAHQPRLQSALLCISDPDGDCLQLC